MNSKITCIDKDACTDEHCPYVRNGCDQEFWKLLCREGLIVGQYQNRRTGLTFYKNEKEIMHVLDANSWAEDEIIEVRPEFIPAGLRDLLSKRKLNELVDRTNARLLSVMMF